jgi:hypothetical protein
MNYSEIKLLRTLFIKSAYNVDIILSCNGALTINKYRIFTFLYE